VQPIVEIQDLGKWYGLHRAVDGLTLHVDPGEIVALLGPNGAGKTTAIRMLMGILQPTRGTARVAGLDCFTERAATKRHIGYLPDEPIFYDHLRGSELLRFVGEMHGLDPGEIDARSQPLIDALELDRDLDEFANNYSKGMKKKLALICALLHRPEVLILDEPTNGLDPFATRTLHAIIREQSAAGTAVFHSTHLLDQAERLCHRVAILHEGRLAACGPVGELRDRLAPGGSLEDVFFEVARRPEDGAGESAAESGPGTTAG
jgi:ABC-2 type transport system ATP-binding protein